MIKKLCKLFIFAISICFSETVTAQDLKDWKIVWQEEFNYTGMPDTNKWGYEVGHMRNNEQQYYTNARKENIRVEKGMLVISGKKESFINARYKAGSTDWRAKDSLAAYTSASINTLGKASWLFGRIEVRAKLPHGGGIWPAIWMMGINVNTAGWPFCGETDIMEFVGNRPSDIYGTIHYPDPTSKKPASKGGKINNETLERDFHLYAIEWDNEKIDIFLMTRSIILSTSTLQAKDQKMLFANHFI